VRARWAPRSYRALPTVPGGPIADRRWPSRSHRARAAWCSVDLRDGNQALVEPMGPERKARDVRSAGELGFKEIEVGFPSASQPDFDFVRELIERAADPARRDDSGAHPGAPELIDRTFEAIDGAPRAIVHVYNATSPLFRASSSVSTAPASSTSRCGGAAHQAARARSRRARATSRVLARDVYRDRARVRQRDLRGGDGRPGTTRRTR
jgi:hypothetical protein